MASRRARSTRWYSTLVCGKRMYIQVESNLFYCKVTRGRRGEGDKSWWPWMCFIVGLGSCVYYTAHTKRARPSLNTSSARHTHARSPACPCHPSHPHSPTLRNANATGVRAWAFYRTRAMEEKIPRTDNRTPECWLRYCKTVQNNYFSSSKGLFVIANIDFHQSLLNTSESCPSFQSRVHWVCPSVRR